MPEPGAAKVTLPGFGEVDRKYAVVGAITAGGIVGIVYLRRRSKAAAAATASTGGQQTDPAGNVGVIDPQTGFVYGSPEDQSGLSGSFGYGGITGFGSSNTSAGAGTTGTAAGGDNETWLTNAENILPGDQSVIAAALLAVLGGEPVTADQRNLFMEAVGVIGPPPAGYPTPIKLIDTPGQPQPPAPGPPAPAPAPGPSAPVPDVHRLPAPTARQVLVSAGFNVGGSHANSPATVIITSQTPAAGTQIPYNSPYWPAGNSQATVDIG